MRISEIEIFPLKPREGLLGFTSFVLDEQFYIGGVSIYSAPQKPEGLRLVFPAKRSASGKDFPLAHPITGEAERLITKAVSDKFNKVVQGFNV